MNIEDLASKIYNFAQSNKDGFTLNLNTLKPVTTGIVVSYKPTQNSFSESELQSVINHALEHDGIVGGWYNKKDKRYYFDSNKVFNINELDKAIAFGLKNEQIAIFDIDSGKEIWLNEKGSEKQTFTLKKFSFYAFADWFLNTANQVVKHYRGDILIDAGQIMDERNNILYKQSVGNQGFSLYWGVRETGTWLYHKEGENLFGLNDLMRGLGAKNVYLITFQYDTAKNEVITVREMDKETI